MGKLLQACAEDRDINGLKMRLKNPWAMGLSVTLECGEQAAVFTLKKALLNGLWDDEWIFQKESACSHSSYHELYHCSISGTPLKYNYP